jgi:predicted 3-demethylubiquinone-9 3-methyltransferase (glyoxalase superfamily)
MIRGPKGGSAMATVTPFLWFNGKAEEAANFYVSIFKNAKIETVARWGGGGPAPAGAVMSVTFTIDGRELIAFNGGPEFSFTPAFSMMVTCETQAELDELWDKLLAGGGPPSRCGWLKDRFGLSWQIIPKRLGELLRSPRAMKAMMEMVKLDIRVLEEAARSSP